MARKRHVRLVLFILITLVLEWNLPGNTANAQNFVGEHNVEFYVDPNYSGTAYTHNDPTNGFYNALDYMDDKISSTNLKSNYSTRMYDGTNGTGISKCIVRPVADMSGAYFSDRTSMNDRISSYEIFNNSDCSGSWDGTQAGDAVTFYQAHDWWGGDPNMGYHDPISGDMPNWLVNINSIGMASNWSVIVYSDYGNTGESYCIQQKDSYLGGDDVYPSGAEIAGNIKSISIFFNDTTCGGYISPTPTFTPTPTATATDVTPSITPTNTATATSTLPTTVEFDAFYVQTDGLVHWTCNIENAEDDWHTVNYIFNSQHTELFGMKKSNINCVDDYPDDISTWLPPGTYDFYLKVEVQSETWSESHKTVIVPSPTQPTFTPTHTPTSTPTPTPTSTSQPSVNALIVTANCNVANLEVVITSGDGPFNITASAGVDTPQLGANTGVTIIVGPEKWDDLTVAETSGDTQAINLGQFKCRSDERPTPLAPAHKSHITSQYPMFIWTAVTAANNYRLFVYDDSVPATRTVDIRGSSGGPTQLTLGEPLPHMRLFWRVRARTNRIWSFWSIRFTLFIDSPQSMTLQTPIPTIDLSGNNQAVPTVEMAPPNSR